MRVARDHAIELPPTFETLGSCTDGRISYRYSAPTSLLLVVRRVWFDYRCCLMFNADEHKNSVECSQAAAAKSRVEAVHLTCHH